MEVTEPKEFFHKRKCTLNNSKGVKFYNNNKSMYWHFSNEYSMRQIIQASKIIWGEFSSLLRNAMLYCRGAAKGNSLLPEIEIRGAVKYYWQQFFFRLGVTLPPYPLSIKSFCQKPVMRGPTTPPLNGKSQQNFAPIKTKRPKISIFWPKNTCF